MNTSNLAIVFGPTLMGTSTGPNIQDSGWQVRVIDTILQNTYQIFDDDWEAEKWKPKIKAKSKGFDKSGEEERDLARGAFRDCKITLGTGVEEEHCRSDYQFEGDNSSFLSTAQRRLYRCLVLFFGRNRWLHLYATDCKVVSRKLEIFTGTLPRCSMFIQEKHVEFAQVSHDH